MGGRREEGRTGGRVGGKAKDRAVGKVEGKVGGRVGGRGEGRGCKLGGGWKDDGGRLGEGQRGSEGLGKGGKGLVLFAAPLPLMAQAGLVVWQQQ